MTLKGLDVSSYDATLTRAACAPFAVVWARATHPADINGPVDTKWAANRAVLSGLVGTGTIPGAYHAIDGSTSGASQAALFLSALPSNLDGWSLFVDWETEPNTAPIGTVKEFLNTLGLPCGLYASDAWWDWQPIGQAWNFIAAYPGPPKHKADVHQYEAVQGVGDHSYILSALSKIMIGGTMDEQQVNALIADALKVASVKDAGTWFDRFRGMEDALAGRTATSTGAQYTEGYQAMTALMAKAGSGTGSLPDHEHVPGTGNTGGVAP